MLRRERTEAVADLGEISLRLRVASAAARASKHEGFRAAIPPFEARTGESVVAASVIPAADIGQIRCERLRVRIAGRAYRPFV